MLDLPAGKLQGMGYSTEMIENVSSEEMSAQSVEHPLLPVSAPSAIDAGVQLSLVIPAYNEESRLRSTLEKAIDFLAISHPLFELLMVDDGSSDSTVEIATEFSRHDPRIKVISIPHAGKAAAVRAGMNAATGQFVAFTDADLATPLSYLTDFVTIASNGADVVIGSREGMGSRRIGEPWYRHFMGRVFNRMVQMLVLPGIEDTQCGFKLFRQKSIRTILDRALLYQEIQAVVGPRVTAFDVELLVIARSLGFTIVTEPVVWTYGTNSKVNPIRDTLHNAFDILRIKRNMLSKRYRS